MVAGALACAAAGPEPAGAPEAERPTAEVIVTGSHVRGAEIPATNVQVLDRVLLEQTGASQVSDLITQVPSNTGTTLYNENGPLTGTAQFSLRGLGFSSTLTLLNGRRAGVSPLSDKSGADFVDINQFPLAMIERVDVLKDGSSAIYGSEAVAGVVNLVTRKGFEGLELSGNYASSSNDAWSINLAAGRRFDNGSLAFYATYYDQTGNLRSDFPWLMERVGGNGEPGRSQFLSTNGYPASWQRANVNASGVASPVTGALFVSDPGCEAAGGVFAINDTGSVDTTRCRFDFTDQIGVIPSQRRIQSFIEGEYALTDRVTYFNETSASRNVNYVYSQAGGYSGGTAPGGAVYVPANHPFNFFTADPANPRNIIYVDPTKWDNAVNTAVPVVASFRPEGQYVSAQKRQTNTYLRTVNGFDVSITRNWSAQASHEYAYAEFVENLPLGANAPNINGLLVSGRYNPFASSVLTPSLVSPKDGTSLAHNDQSIIDQIFYTTNVTRRTKQEVTDLSVSGPVLDLSTGAVSLAVGGQYRTQQLNYIPDSLAAQGLSTPPTRDAPFSGRLNVWAEYAEVIVPFHDTAQLQAAVRHEDYGDGPGATTDPKISGRLNLLSGKLSLRGSWGTSFQAPTLTQGVTTKTLLLVNDPVVLGPNGYGCSTGTIGTGALVITSGGNLQPQNSANFGVGFDVQPVQSLKLTTDYWRYDYSDLIASGQNAQSIVGGECVNGVYSPDPRVERAASGIVNTVSTSFVNVGKVITDGVDFSGAYNLELQSAGDLTFMADTTYVRKFDAYGATGAVLHAVGSRNFNTNFAPMPRWRGAARTRWSMGPHGAAVNINYTGGYHNDQSNNAPISSFTTVDVQYALTLKDLFGSQGATEFSLGLVNAFDRDPPALRRYNAAGQFISGTVSDIDRPGYDPLSGANIQGRSWYVRFKQRF